MADATEEGTPMRAEEDTPMRTEEDTSMRTEDDSESGGDSGSGSDEEEELVEWLATSRAKRSTAGNRLNALLQQEDPDDEVQLLFEEQEDDTPFQDEEANQSDVEMDSSSDEEDQGPAAGADDLEGEKEIQRQAKAERQAKRRKLNDGIPKVKRRVRIDPTLNEPAPRPKKKSERASWIPTAEDAPTRASARGTTQMSKQQLHQQMVEREIKRLKQLANMKAAEAAKEAAKKPALTQEDRLREAARVEKSNSKSLSRWEQTEKDREEEQRARLAALQNRKLEGPVITWWSGMAEYVGGKLKKVGQMLTITEKEKVGRKRKAAEMEADSAKTGDSKEKEGSQGPKTEDIPMRSSQPPKQDTPVDGKPPSTDATPNVESPAPKEPEKPPSVSPPVEAPVPPPEPPRPSPMLAPPMGSPFSVPDQPPASSVLAPPPINRPPVFTPPPPHPNSHPLHPAFHPTAPPALDGSAPLPGFGYNFMANYPPNLPTSQIPFNVPPQPLPPEVPPGPPAIEHSNLNYLILSNFDEDSIKEKDVQTQVLFSRTFPKLKKPPKSSEPCAITGYPAKYRDPVTGLAYCNVAAYKEIQKLQKGELKWSKLIGAYVGPGGYAARGVPPRFLNPLYKPPQPAVAPAEVKQST